MATEPVEASKVMASSEDVDIKTMQRLLKYQIQLVDSMVEL